MGSSCFDDAFLETILAVTPTENRAADTPSSKTHSVFRSCSLEHRGTRGGFYILLPEGGILRHQRSPSLPHDGAGNAQIGCPLRSQSPEKSPLMYDAFLLLKYVALAYQYCVRRARFRGDGLCNFLWVPSEISASASHCYTRLTSTCSGQQGVHYRFLEDCRESHVGVCPTHTCRYPYRSGVR